MKSKLRSNKLKNIFNQDCLIDQKLILFASHLNKIPKFVADYLVSHFVSSDNINDGLDKINQLLDKRFVSSNKKELIKSRIRKNGSYDLIGPIHCRYDPKKDEYFATVQALSDNNVRIDERLIEENEEMLLSSGGCWGKITISFDITAYDTQQQSIHPFIITDFVPFQITNINLEHFMNARDKFQLDEWIDIIINTMGFNPDTLTEDEKFIYLYRLIPLVESNINLIELGGVETGKTFTYKSLSNYSFVLSGSQSTVASLFYHKVRKKIGLLGTKDCILFDEISSNNFKMDTDIINMLKDYMNSGSFSRDDMNFTSDCSIIFAGNIECDREAKQPLKTYRSLFDPLPKEITTDRAFLDRISGLIPGWQAAQITSEKFSQEIAFMSDYFSEILHRLRDQNYRHIISNRVNFNNVNKRTEEHVIKLSTGLLKILFPNAMHYKPSNEELEMIVNHASNLRISILEQMNKISPKECIHTNIDFDIKHQTLTGGRYEPTTSFKPLCPSTS